MDETLSTARYDALGEDAKRYVDAAAIAIYVVDNGLDGKAGSRQWDRQVADGSDAARRTVADYRRKALAAVEALAAMTARAGKEEVADAGDGEAAAEIPVPAAPSDGQPATMQ